MSRDTRDWLCGTFSSGKRREGWRDRQHSRYLTRLLYYLWGRKFNCAGRNYRGQTQSGLSSLPGQFRLGVRLRIPADRPSWNWPFHCAIGRVSVFHRIIETHARVRSHLCSRKRIVTWSFEQLIRSNLSISSGSFLASINHVFLSFHRATASPSLEFECNYVKKYMRRCAFAFVSWWKNEIKSRQIATTVQQWKLPTTDKMYYISTHESIVESFERSRWFFASLEIMSIEVSYIHVYIRLLERACINTFRKLSYLSWLLPIK